MVLSNSTPNHNITNSSRHNELVVDTAAMNSADLSELLQLNAEIDERRMQRHSLAGDGTGLLRNTMTREELFEISSLDDDRFLTALEYQNSYVAPSPAQQRRQVTDLDLSSIENLMKYFDEEVPVTPTKSGTTGQVASAIATIKMRTEPMTTPTQNKRLGGQMKISELKQKYESPEQKYETKTTKPAKLPMKVKEIAQLFNAKISQVMRRSSDGQQYVPLRNEYSPEPKPKPKTPPPRPKAVLVSYGLPGLPSPQPRSIDHNPCLVAEEVFRELSVKDKALLFNKFVGDMSAKHPKFNVHAAGLQAQVKKQIARGEVVAEQQASVKQLTQELEAKCVLQQAHASPPAKPQPVQKSSLSSSSSSPSSPPPSLHVSTLTVVLRPSPEVAPAKRQLLPLAKRLELLEPEATHKRNLAAIRHQPLLPTEAYAPPKKIRRTRNERNDGQTFFQNEPLETLFYSWLREENGVLFDITNHTEQTIEIAHDEAEEPQLELTAEQSQQEQPSHATVDISQKSAVERLLEEAIAKLEESKAKEDKSAQLEEKDVDTAIDDTQLELDLLIATAVTATPVDTPADTPTSQRTPRKVKRQAPPVPAPRTSLQTSSSASCCSSMITSTSTSCKQSEAEESESGLSMLPKITSDDSQPEDKAQQTQDVADFEFAKPVRPPRKKKMRRTLTWKKENSIVEATAVTSTDSDSDYKKAPQQHHVKKKVAAPSSCNYNNAEQSYLELDKSLMRHVNSPRKIKSAYTLTIMSSPSPNVESDQSETPRQSLEQPSLGKERRSLADSFVDQGFETSNDLEQSPMRRSVSRPLSASPRPTLESASPKPSGFSTPVKGHGQRSFVTAPKSKSEAQQQLFSPIAQGRSVIQAQPRRSSLAMQVIREDHPLDLGGTSSATAMPGSPLSASESAFFANAPTIEMPSNLDELSLSKAAVSQFWISAGDFTISLEIFHNAPDRLRLLYEIFTQKSSEARDLAFGIDGHKFELRRGSEVKAQAPTERLPNIKDCSHYWFASGDLAVPFSGRQMAAEKVQRLFQFISEELGDNEELRFGVDHIEFSGVPEFWHNTPKFSIESSYSMLVGLQTGNSNGLEGRSKYAWPHNATIKTSDLDHSEFESDCFSNSGRLSFSPDMFSLDYEAVPLDELFDQKPTSPTTKMTTKIKNMSMPLMIETLQQQQSKLKAVEQRIRSYSKPANLSDNSLDHYRNTPEYIQKLRSIINAIDNIGRDNGFRVCSLEQLESFMYFLSEYADVCLANCSEHMDKILDTLLDRRAVSV